MIDEIEDIRYLYQKKLERLNDLNTDYSAGVFPEINVDKGRGIAKLDQIIEDMEAALNDLDDYIREYDR